jgi:acetyltransferase
MAFIVEGIGELGEAETLAVGRTVSDPDREEAEFALMVRSDLKGQGLGHLLLAELVRHARSRGIGRLVGIVLRENSPMLQLAQSMGFRRDAERQAGSDTWRVVLPLSQP